MWSPVATALIVCAISITNVHPYLMLSDSDINEVRDLILSFVRFSVAQRVDPLDFNQKVVRSVSEMLDHELGREELKAIDNYLSSLINKALSKRPISDDEYQKYILNEGQLLLKLFSTDLSAGYVEHFPKYYYNGTGNGTIHVIEEVISAKQYPPNYSNMGDLGPPLPEFPERIIDTTPANVFENVQIWMSDVGDEFKNPSEYRLYHIIPPSVLERFYELFSAVWKKQDHKNQQILLAPFRVLNVTSQAAQYITAGRELNSPSFDGDYEKLKKMFTYVYKFDYDIKKYFFWAMGNLYWGFKSRSDLTTSESDFDRSSETVTGHSRYEEAETMYYRLEDFLQRFDWTKEALSTVSESQRQNRLQNIVKNITHDKILFNEMKDLMFHFVYFGLDRDDPYQVKPSQWEKDQGGKWRLKSLEQVGEVEDPSYETLSEGCEKHVAEGICHVTSTIKDMVKLEANYKKVEDCLVRDIVSNQVHLVTFNHMYRNSSTGKGKQSTTLAEIDRFIRQSLHDDHFNSKCRPDNEQCKAFESMCKSGTLQQKRELPFDSKSPGKAPVAVKPFELLFSTSFEDWCTGYKFKNPNKITYESAFIKLMTYKTGSESIINSTIYNKIFKDYLLDDEDSKVIDYFDFVEDELKKPQSTSSKLLMDICKEASFVDILEHPTESNEAGVSHQSFYQRHKTSIIALETVAVGGLLIAGMFAPVAILGAGALGVVLFLQSS